MRRAVTIRWQELVAAERALDEMEEYLGHRYVLPEVDTQLALCKEKILELHDGIQMLTGKLALAGPTERFLEAARGRVRWEDLKPSQPPGQTQWNPRDGLYPALKEEVEAAEEEWLAMLAPRLPQ